MILIPLGGLLLLALLYAAPHIREARRRQKIDRWAGRKPEEGR